MNTPGGFYDAKKDQTFREIVKNSPKSYAASFKTNQKRIDLPTEKKGSTDVLYNPRNGTFTEIMAKKGNASAMKSNVKRQAFTDTKFKLGNGPDRFYDVHRGTMAEDTKKSPRGYSAAFKTTQKRIDDSRDRFKLGSVDIMYDAKDPRYVTPAYKTRPQVAAFGSSVPRTKKRREPKVSKDGGSRRGSRAGSSVGTNTPKSAGDVTPKSPQIVAPFFLISGGRYWYHAIETCIYRLGEAPNSTAFASGIPTLKQKHRIALGFV